MSDFQLYEDGLSALLADNSDRIVTTHAALNEHVGTSVDWDVVRELCVVVDELEISIRVANALDIANIKYIWELVLYTEARLLKTKNFGRKSLNEVKDVLTNTPPGCMPLTLGMHRDDPQRARRHGALSARLIIARPRHLSRGGDLQSLFQVRPPCATPTPSTRFPRVFPGNNRATAVAAFRPQVNPQSAVFNHI